MKSFRVAALRLMRPLLSRAATVDDFGGVVEVERGCAPIDDDEDVFFFCADRSCARTTVPSFLSYVLTWTGLSECVAFELDELLDELDLELELLDEDE